MASARKSALDTLASHRMRLDAQPMRQLFADDPGRFDSFSVRFGDMLLDYSKNRIDSAAMKALFDLAHKAGVESRRDAMWAGEPINVTEHRAVMHMALRYQGDSIMVGGENVMPGVREVLDRMRDFSADVRSGAIRGATGKPFTDVVNIGIGGSDLGPAMVTLALEPYTRSDLRVHYVLQYRRRPYL